MASQLENPALKEEKYMGDIYGGYVQWLKGSHPFPHSGFIGSTAGPKDPSSAREGLSFPPHVQSVVFSPWPCSPQCLQLPAETKKHRSRQAAVSISLCRQAEPEG